MNSVHYFYGGGNSAHYSIDRLLPNNSTVLYKSNDGYNRMFLYETDVYKVISSSIVFAALVNSENLSLKPYLMAEMINYFLGIGIVTGISDLLAGNSQTSVNSYPNPFNASTTISFTLTENSFVQVAIYDAMGKMVRNLGGENLSAGEHAITWDATNDDGMHVEKGFYFYTIQMDEQLQSGTLIYIK